MKRKMDGDTICLMDGNTQVLSMQEVLDEESKVITVTVTGELKNDTAHDFGDELLALAGFGQDIRLSLEGVSYVSNMVMRTLLEVQKRLDKVGRGSLTLLKVDPAVLKSMESTGLTELLMIE